MNAINVKGIRTLKHYPREPMVTQEGYLTEAQAQELIQRQTLVISRLQHSNQKLLTTLKYPNLCGTNTPVQSKSLFGTPKDMEELLQELIARDAKAIQAQKALNDIRIAERNLAAMKEKLKPSKPSQLNIFHSWEDLEFNES